MARNLANCPINELRDADVPDSYTNGDTSQCGISYPQQTPLANLTACCVGEVQVNNGCFQYCEVSDDQAEFFSQCVRDSVFQNGLFGSGCNKKATTSAGHRDCLEATAVRWKVAMAVVGVLGMAAFSW